ncbi:MAG: N-formylglutamate amidohydrolase [Phyllobacterium sp.]|uniref:N-formylglutamate amidohydrolase n=1 Tax=Phyllobacterium sp. TaxID=1871046 RepID=UPI0030F10D24
MNDFYPQTPELEVHDRTPEPAAQWLGSVNRKIGAADWWTVHRGLSPILATAIHNGHAVRPEVRTLMAISGAERLREEDPFTDFAGCDVPNRIVFHRSRFEVDLNRARNAAIYLSPEQAWGMNIWNETPDPGVIEDTLNIHDAYYLMLRNVLRELEKHHGQFVVLDIHSYNHRRGGPDAEPSDPNIAPEINIGTHSMDRDRWAHVVDPLIEKLRTFEFRGHRMDVRENEAFEGKGEQTRFIHETFPQTGCAFAIEFKKFFMDEWTGIPDRKALIAIRAMVRSTLPVLEECLRATR